MANNKLRKMRFCLLHIDHITEGHGLAEKPLIRMWGKSEEGKNVVALDRNFDPYFYVRYDEGLSNAEITLLRKRIMDIEIEGRKPLKAELIESKYLGKPVKLLKVYVRLPSDVPKYKDLLKDWKEVERIYEYGISFYKRYLIDNGIIPIEFVEIEGSVVKNTGYKADIVMNVDRLKPVEFEKRPQFNILSFDIEMIRESGQEKIIMVSFKDNNGFSKVICADRKKVPGVEPVGNEKKLLKRFVEIINKNNPDIIVGYNTDRFDFLAIENKANQFKIPLTINRDGSNFIFSRRGNVSAAQIKGRVHIDLYDFIERIMSSGLSTEVLSLDRVSRELLGEGKDDLDYKDMIELWKKKDIAPIAKYCLKDSDLSLNLAKILLPQIFEISKVIGQVPFDTSRMSYSQLVEWLLIRKAFSAGEIVPNRPKYNEINVRKQAASYIGGYVHSPVEGIHEKIALFDFQSLYPSITITHNVSPETLDCSDCKTNERNNVPESSHFFCSKKKGFVPLVIEEIINKRNEIKAKMEKLGPRSFEYKALYNRQYAMKIIANASYGYYGYAGSRWYSRICAESITAWGRMYIKNVIEMAQSQKYEVIYGDTDSLFVKINSKKNALEFLKKVNDTLPGVMELDFRNIYDTGIFVTTKKGIGAKKRYALIDKEGNMTIRGFEKVRRDWSDIAKKTQENVLRYILKDKSTKKAVNVVRNTIDNIRKGKVDMDELVIYSSLTKPIEDYEQVSPHVIAARKMLSRGITIRRGSLIAYIITKGTGSISERAEPAETADNYDPDYYIHNQVLPAALRVLSGLGYTEEDMLSNKKIEQVSLKDFVKK